MFAGVNCGIFVAGTLIILVSKLEDAELETLRKDKKTVGYIFFPPHFTLRAPAP